MQGERTDIPPLATRFAARFQPGHPNQCWLWTGSLNSYGYGRIKDHGRERLAHRLAYEYAHGLIPAGMEIDHTCHTTDATCPGGICQHRRCVNPHHLELVTTTENTRRRDIIQRRTVCRAGHPLEGDNLYLWIGSDGYTRRYCRQCRADRARQP
jgi:hypothetical protein